MKVCVLAAPLSVGWGPFQLFPKSMPLWEVVHSPEEAGAWGPADPEKTASAGPTQPQGSEETGGLSRRQVTENLWGSSLFLMMKSVGALTFF